MSDKMTDINCRDYVNCVGCPFRKLVDMDMYDEYGNVIGTERISFCERNGKVDEVFTKGTLKDLLED